MPCWRPTSVARCPSSFPRYPSPASPFSSSASSGSWTTPKVDVRRRRRGARGDAARAVQNPIHGHGTTRYLRGGGDRQRRRCSLARRGCSQREQQNWSWRSARCEPGGACPPRLAQYLEELRAELATPLPPAATYGQGLRLSEVLLSNGGHRLPGRPHTRRLWTRGRFPAVVEIDIYAYPGRSAAGDADALVDGTTPLKASECSLDEWKAYGGEIRTQPLPAKR